jgi:hypothetical protein
MSDIAIRDEQHAVQAYQKSSIDRLQLWAEQAVAARQYADAVCDSSLVPTAYRGKPNEAAAAILAGAELGFDPMASLRAFDNIQGTPAPKAITLRAVAQSKGHRIRVVESTDQIAVVEGCPRGTDDWQRSTWDIPRAERMGLLDKAKDPSRNQWKLQPAAMLVARATAEVCRWIASDAIMGMPYAAEEIADHTGMQAGPVTRQVTAADIVGQAAEHAAPTPKPASEQQLQDIRELFGNYGITSTDERRAFVSRAAGRNVDSLDTLTLDEAEHVINDLIATGGQP